MRTARGVALRWIREVLQTYGQPRLDGSCLVPMNQAELSEASGWSAASGTVSAYLNALGPAVLQRRGGIVVDRAALARLEQTNPGPEELPSRTYEVAKLLALRLGRPGPRGTELVMSEPEGERPARVVDMAAAVSLSPSTVSRHLARLRRAGRIRRRGRTWVFPAVAAGEAALVGPISRDVRSVLDQASTYLELAVEALGEGADHLAAFQPLADELPVAALAESLHTMFTSAESLLAELGRGRSGRILIDWGVDPQLLWGTR